MIDNNIEINIKKIVLFDNADNDYTDYKNVIEDFKSQLTNLIEINGVDKSSNYDLSYDVHHFNSTKINKQNFKFSGNDLAHIVFEKIINSYSLEKGN